MEAKLNFFFKSKKEVSSPKTASSSSTTTTTTFSSGMTSSGVDTRKYIKISRMLEKRVSPEAMSQVNILTPKPKKGYDSTLFVCEAEKIIQRTPSKIKKKREVVMEDKGTEITPSLIKMAMREREKEKMREKEKEKEREKEKEEKEKEKKKVKEEGISFSKYQRQYSSISSPRSFPSAHRKSGFTSNLYLTLYEEVQQGGLFGPDLEGLLKACKIFSYVRSGKIYVNDVHPTLRVLKISISDGDILQALKSVYIDANGILDFSDFLKILNEKSQISQDPAFQEAFQIFGKMKGGRVDVDDVMPILNTLGISVSFQTYQEVMNYLYRDANRMVDFGDFIFSLEDLQQQYEDVVYREWLPQEEFEKRLSKSRASRVFQQLRKKSSSITRSSESFSSMRSSRKSISERIAEETFDLAQRQSSKSKKSLERVDMGVPESLRSSSRSSISFRKLSGPTEISKGEVTPPKAILASKGVVTSSKAIQTSRGDITSSKAIPAFRKLFHEPDMSAVSEAQQKMLKVDESKSQEEPDKYEICFPGTQPCGSVSSLRKILNIEEIPVVRKSSSLQKSAKETEKKYAVSVTDLQPQSVKSHLIYRKPLSEIHVEKSFESSSMSGLSLEKAEDISEEGREVQPETFGALQRSITYINKIRKDEVPVNELPTILKILGIELSDEEFQDVLQMTPPNESDMVNLKDFLTNLSKSRQFTEYSVLKDAIPIIEDLEEKKANVDDLKHDLRKLGIYCTQTELERALEQVPPDSEGHVNFKDFAQALKEDPFLGKRKSLEESLKEMKGFKGNKVSVDNLWRTLHRLDANLTEEEFQEALKAVPKDEEGKIEFDKFFEALEGIQESVEPKPKLKGIPDNILALSKIAVDKMVPKKDLDHVLKSIGIVLSKETLENILSSSDSEMIDVKEVVSSLRNTENFSTCLALKELVTQMDEDKTVPHHVEDVYSQIREKNLPPELRGKKLSSQEIEDITGSHPLKDMDIMKFNMFMNILARSKDFPVKDAFEKGMKMLTHLEKGKVSIPDLLNALANVNINIPKETLDRIFESCPTDENGDIWLKDFINGLTQTQQFADSIALQLAVSGLENVEDDLIETEEIQESLTERGLEAANEVLTQMLPDITNEQGKIEFPKFMSDISKVLLVPRVSGIPESFNETILSRKDSNILFKLQENVRVMGIHLDADELEEALENTTVDENGMVNFKVYANELTEMDNFKEFQKIDDAWNILHKLGNGKVKPDNLSQALGDLGIKVTDKNLKEVLKLIQPDENGEIKIMDVINVLSATPELAKPPDMKDVWDVLNKVGDEKVNIDDVCNTLDDLGIKVTEEEFHQVLQSIQPEEDGFIKMKDVVQKLAEIPGFIEPPAVVVKALSKVGDEKVNIDDVCQTLDDLGIKVAEEKLQEIVQSIQPDESGSIKVKDVVQKLAETPGFIEPPVDVWDVLNKLGDEKVKTDDVSSALDDLGIRVTEKNLQEILQSIQPDEAGSVKIKDVVQKLADAQEFTGPTELQKAWTIVTNITDGKIKKANILPTLESLGFNLNDEDLQEALKSFQTDGDLKDIDLREFIKKYSEIKNCKKTQQLQDAWTLLNTVSEGKVKTSDLGKALETMGIALGEEEIQDIEKYTDTGEDGTVSLQDVIDKLTNAQKMSEGQRIQNAVNVVTSVKDGKVKMTDVPSVLDSLGFDVDAKETTEILNSIVPDEGEVNLKEVVKKLDDSKKLEQAQRFENAKMVVTSVNQGKVNVDDLDNTLKSLGINLTDEHVQELKKAVEVDEEGMVNLDEVVKKLMDEKKQKAQILEDAAFIVSSVTDGKVKVSDLAPVLKHMGADLANEDVKEALKSVDVDETGMVNLEAFVNQVPISKLSPKIQQNKKIHDIINNVVDGKINIENLKPTLEGLGIRLSDEELRRAIKSVKVDEDGNMDFKDIVEKAEESLYMTENKRLQDAKNIISNVSDGKVNIDDLPSTLESLGIDLSERDIKKILESVEPLAEDGMVDFKDVVSKVAELRDTKKKKRITFANPLVSNFIDKKIKPEDVVPILESLELPISDENIKKALESTEFDEDGKIKFDKFINELMKTGDCAKSQRIQDANNFVNNIVDGKVNTEDVMPILKSLGIDLSKEKLADILKSVKPDEKGKVKFQDVVNKLISSKRALKAQQLEDARKILTNVVDGKVAFEDLQPTLESLGIDLTDEALKETLESIEPDENGNVDFDDSVRKFLKHKNSLLTIKLKRAQEVIDTVSDGKIHAKDLSPTLENFGIKLTDDMLKDTVKSVGIDGDGTVNVKNVVEKLFQNEKLPKDENIEKSLNAVAKIAEGNIKITDLSPLLETLDIDLTEEDLQKTLKTVDTKGGMVNLKTFVDKLASLEQFPECQRIEDACVAVKSITDKKVPVEELMPTLKQLGVKVSKEDVEEILRVVTPDKDGTVDIMEFLDQLAKSEPFNDLKRVEDACNFVSSIKDGKVKVDDLPSTLETLGVNLTPEELKETLKSVQPDDNGAVNLKDFFRELNDTEKFEKCQQLKVVCDTLNKIPDGKVNVSELTSTMNNLGIPLNPDEINETLASVKVDENGTINLKDFMDVLSKTKKFLEGQQLEQMGNAMLNVIDGKANVKDLAPTLQSLGVPFSNEEINKMVKNVQVDADGTVNLKNFVDNLIKKHQLKEKAKLEKLKNIISHILEGKIQVDDLESALKNLGIVLSEKELQDTLKAIEVDESGEVDLRTLGESLNKIEEFNEAKRIQSTCSMVSHISEGKVKMEDLPDTLSSLEVECTEEELKEALKTAVPDENNMVNLNTLIAVLSKNHEMSDEKKRIEDAFNLVNSVLDGKIEVSKLSSVLENSGITPTYEEIKETLKNIGAEDSKMVDLKDFIEELGQMNQSSVGMEPVLEVLDNLSDGKIKVDELAPFLDNFGIHLTKEELEETQKSLGVEDDGVVDLNKFLDSYAKDKVEKAPSIREISKMITPIAGGKVLLEDVESALEGLKFNLSDEDIKEAVKSVVADDQGYVDLKKVIKNISESESYQEDPALKNALNFIINVDDRKVNVNDLVPIMEKLGISLNEEELNETLKSLQPDENETVNLQNFIRELSKNEKYQEIPSKPPETKMTSKQKYDLLTQPVRGDSESLEEKHQAIFKIIDDLILRKEETIPAEELKSLLSDFDITVRADSVIDVLERVSIDEGGSVGLKDCLLALDSIQRLRDDQGRDQLFDFLNFTDRMVDVSDLQSILKDFGIIMPENDIREVIKDIPVNDDGKVSLKECVAALKETPVLTKAAEMENPLDIFASIKANEIPVKTLDTFIKSLGVNLKPTEFDDILKSMPVKAGEKVDLEKFLEAVSDMKSVEEDEKQPVVDVANLNTVLEDMGVHLSPKEIQSAMDLVTVGDDGKVDLNEFMNSMQYNQNYAQLDDNSVDVNKLRAFLSNSGIHLTEKETQEILKHTPVDDNGEVNKKEFMAYMLNTRKPSQYEKKKVDANKLKYLLDLLGIQVPDEDIQEVLQNIPVEDGKVNLKAFMDALQDSKKVPLYEGMKTDIQNLSNILSSMRVDVKDDELQELLRNLPVGEDGRIDMDKVMQIVKTHQKKAPEEEEVDSSHLDAVLKDLGIHFNEEELKDLLKNQPVNADGKVKLDKVMDSLKTFKGGKVDMNYLEDVLDKMGLQLTEEEEQDLIKEVPIDENGMMELKKLINALKEKKAMTVGVNNLDEILGNMGVGLSKEELQNLVKSILVDHDGSIDLNKLIDAVKSMKGGKVNVSNLDNFLNSTGEDLTKDEMEDLLKMLHVGADGKVDVAKLEESLQAIKDEKIDANNLNTFLKNMGIDITGEELKELKQNLPTDAHGKVNQKLVMEALKDSKGVKLDADELDTILGNMEIKFSNEELKNISKQLPLDAEGKAEMTKLMDSVQAVKGEKLDVQNLDNQLSKMGLELSDEEVKELMKYLPVDRKGSVYQSDLINALKAFKAGKADAQNLEDVLKNMGIKLTDAELQEVLKYTPTDDNGKMDIKKVLDEVKASQGEKVDIGEIGNFLKNTGIEVPAQELQELLKNLPGTKKASLTKVMDNLQTSIGGKVSTSNLDDFLNNMGIKVTESDLKVLKRNLPVNGDGKIDLNTLLNEVKAFQEKHDISDVENVLRSMGLEFSKKELQELQKNLPVDENGMVNMKKIMNAVKNVSGGNVDVNNLENVLHNMGIDLTEKELMELLNNLPVDADGKVNLDKSMDYAKTIKDNVNVQNLEDFLKDMGINLAKDEQEDLLKNLPIDANGMVNKKSLMNAVQNLGGGNVDVNKVDQILGNLGVQFTDKEIEDLLSNLPIDADGSVALNKVIENVKTLKDNVNVQNLEDFLKDMGINLAKDEQEDLLKNLPIGANGMVNKKNLMNAVKNLSGGDVDVNKLDQVLRNLGIQLTDKEIEELLSKLPLTKDGKVNLKGITDNAKTIQENVDVQNLNNFLKDMGIKLTEEEQKDLLERLPVGANGKVNKKNVMNAVQNLGGGNVDVSKVEEVLRNLGIKLTDEEVEELLRNLPIDADGKIDFKKIIENAKTIQENIDVKNLEDFLKSMGIKLTKDEQEDLLKRLPIGVNEKVNKKNIMNAMQNLSGGNVDVNKLDQVLGNLGIELTDKETEELLSNLPIDDDGKVNLKEVIDNAKSIQEKIDVQNLEEFLKDMGIKLTEEEQKDLLERLPVGANGKVNKKTIVNAVQNLGGGNIDVTNLNQVLGNLGIELTDKENEELLSNLPVDADGKIDLNEVIDKAKTIQENVDVKNLDDFLKDMGIKLTKAEQEDLLNRLPVGVNEKVNKKNIMNAVQNLSGGNVDVNKLDQVLGNLGIELTDKETEELLSNLPIDDDGKVNLKEVIDNAKSIQETIDVQNLEGFLKDMGIKLTEEEQKDLLEHLPVGANGKVNKKNVMNAVQKLGEGANVDVSKLEEVLGNLGVKLTDKETEQLLSNLPIDADGKIDLNEVIDNAKTIQENVDVKNLNNFLKDMGIKLTEEEQEDLLKHLPIGANEKVNKKNVMNALQNLSGGNVDVNKLDQVLGNLDIRLSDKEIEELLSQLPIDDDGKVNLKEVIDKAKTIQETVDVENLEGFLKDMGINLTEEEQKDLLEHLPVGANGKVNKKNVMNAVQNLGEGANVDVSKLEEVLGNLGVKLTDKETEQLLSNLPIDADGKIDLNEVIDKAKTIQENVDVKNLNDFLKDMGIKLTEEEQEDLLKHLPVGANEKVNKKNVMNALQNLSGGNVDVNKLDQVLGNLDIRLSDKEIEELLSQLPIDGDGKVNLKEVIDNAKTIQETIDVQNLEDFLKDMGIKLTEEEQKDLLEYLPVGANGKVNKKNVMNAVQNLGEGANVDVSKLEEVLGNLGVKLTDKETEQLLSNLPIDADGKIDLNEVIDKAKTIQENVDVKNLNDFLKDMGIKLTEEEQEDLLKHLPVGANEKVNKKNVMNALQNLSGGNVDVNKLDQVLGNLDIRLTDKEIEELLSQLPIDDDGKVNLKEVTDKAKSIQETIDVQNLEEFLKDMGIKLTEEEQKDLLEHLPVGAKGKVKKKSIVNAIQNLGEGANVDVIKLDDVLGNLGIKLTDKEIEELLSNLPIDANGKIDLNEVIDKAKTIQENIGVKNLDDFLKYMGIKLTEDEKEDLLKRLPVGANEKVNKKNVMNALQNLSGGNVDVNKLDQVLGNLDIRLTDKEIEELLSQLPIDDDGKVNLKEVIDNAKTIQETVDVQNLEDFLKDTGIELTEEEQKDLLEHLPVGVNGKVNKKNVMNAVQNLGEGVNVDVNKLDNILGNLGIKLTDKEIDSLLSDLPIDDDGKVNLKEVIDNAKTIQENVDFQNLEDFLKDMGINLTEEEEIDLLENLPVGANGKVNRKNVMRAVKNLHKGANVDVSKLDKVLGNLGVKLTDKEIEELLSNLPVDDDGKVKLKEVIDNAKNIQENVDVQNLEGFLKDMGIKLTEEEQKDLLEHLPVGANGKVNKKNVMNAVQNLGEGANVDASKLDNVLGNLGVKLTNKDIEDLLSNLPIDATGMFDLKKVMDNAKIIQENVDIKNLDDFLKDMGIKLTEEEQEDLLKHLPIGANGKVNKKNIMNAMQNLSAGNVDVNKLDQVLGNLGIKFTDKEIEELLSNLPIDDDGKVNLKEVMDNAKTIQENVDVQSLDDFLKDMGIKLTEDEQEDLLKHLPVGANGKVNKINVMNAVQDLSGGNVDVNKLDQVLGNLGIKLIDKEIEELLSKLPIDDDGEVNLKEVMDTVKDIQKNIDVKNLDDFLKDMGIKLTEAEQEDFLKHLPVGVDGKVNKKNIMDAVQNLGGVNVDVNKLEQVLGNLGIKLTDKEVAELLTNLPVDEDGKINVKNVVDTVKTIQDNTDIQNLRDFLKERGIKLTEDELEDLKQLPVTGGIFDVNKMDQVLGILGIKLTDKEVAELLTNLPVDEDRKVNLEKVMDEVKTIQENIDAQNLEHFLKDMGVELTKKEKQALLKELPPDANGKMNKNDIMNALQNLSGEKIDVNNLDQLLGNLGIKLKDSEMKELMNNLPVDDGGKINLKEVMDNVKNVQENIDAHNLEDFLKDMGVELTKKEKQALLKQLPLDANGKMNKKDIMNAVQNLSGGKIDVNNLDQLLGKMEIKLTDSEMKELLNNVPVDDGGKVKLKEVMDNVKNVQENIDAQNLEDFLKDMGVELTKKEKQALLKQLPLDANGKMNKKNIMNALQNFNGGKIDVNKLEQLLGNLGIKLKDSEMKELLNNLPGDDGGKVKLKEVMDNVKNVQDNIDAQNLEDFLKAMGVELTKKEKQALLKQLPIDANGKMNKKDIMNALQNLSGGKIDVNNLEEFLGNLGIKLTDSEMKELMNNLPVDDGGKVNLKEVMDNVKNIQDNIDAQNLEDFLKTMGVQLTKKEKQALLKQLPIDANGKMNKKDIMNALQNLSDGGKVNLKEVMDNVKNIQDNIIDAQNLEDFVKAMGVELTKKEKQALLKQLPLDANGQMNKKDIMNALQNFSGGKIDVNNLNQLLGNLGIKLTDSEMRELLSNLPVDDGGKINLKEVMDNVKNVQDNIDAQNLEDFLKAMGVELTKKEKQALLKQLPLDANGQMNKKDIMNALQNLSGGKIDVNNLDQLLGNLEIKLTDSEMRELLNNLPIDDGVKVNLKEVMDNVKNIQENVSVPNLEKFLKDMGIILTKDEQQDLLNHLPFDGSGKIKKNRLMNSLKNFKGGKVDVHDLDKVLGNLGMDLTDEELQGLLKVLPLESDGKVDLDKLLEFSRSIKDGVTSQMSVSSDSKLKYKLKPLTKIPASHIRGRDFQGFLQDHVKHKERLTQGQLDAFLDAFECFDKDETGCIDSHALQSTAAKLGIDLTNQEIQDELDYADIDRDGKLNFPDFLTVLTDDDRFIQAVVPETDPNSDLVDSTGILLFEMLSKLVETAALPRKSMIDIVCYYRKKYHDAAGRPMWRRYDAGGKKRRKSKRDSMNQGTSTAAFADASRIAIMSEKDLLKFLEELKRCSPPSDSPYAKIPIFPLFPNMDGTVMGKPFKDLQRLELLRKKEPLHFFEDYFFHRRNWKAQAASMKPLENSNWPEEIINIDHMLKKKRQWTVTEAACLRHQVKKATDAYHLGVALGHRKDMLNFWRKIRGDLIGLETGNESFYDTFSTYTWSWNVCQELLSSKDLKLNDSRTNRYSHARALFSSFPYITESDIELGRKRKRKRTLRGQT
ncbi:EF-hand calcium-binding domain-containing protein 3 isoform X5 [Monodelphis domestica]|uniref:EF-hand calcium-binding domain-containing protein 3 isoform X5 n=1 Tax=Monodelphis domestica TaxID=13616 RepID=UPI0024E2314F|nr:EF-hand calcium-binding domain-containing protein 3 isoform X5 [Monodelphis domestica]